MNRPVNSDLIGGVLGLVSAAVFWFSIGDISYLSITFPKTIAMVMALISAVLVIKGFVRPNMRQLFVEGNQTRAIVTGIAIFVWWFAIDKIGFFVSSVVAITFIVSYLALARRRITVPVFALWVAIVIAEVGFFYLIFTRLLHVPLPKGMFL